MFLYNITIKVNTDIEETWKFWQKEIFIPAAMNTGFFYKNEFFQLLEQDELAGKTFVIQFFATERWQYDQFIQEYVTNFNNQAAEKWGDQFIDFRTILRSVK